MGVLQISVFTESRPGRLSRILGTLDDAGVNVRGYSISDTGDYGIARFIVDAPDAALAALSGAGCACTSKEVVCLRLQDTPGELARVMEILSDVGENITYSYSMISTYIILCTDNPEQTEAALTARGVTPITQTELSAI